MLMNDVSYGMLIAFCAYLLERREKGPQCKPDDEDGPHESLFSSWMKEHSEVQTILTRATLE